MKKIITKEFQGNKVNTFMWNDRACWIANEIVSLFDYADTSKTTQDCIIAEEFEIGIEYEVLVKDDLKVFKNMVNSLTTVKVVSQNTANLTIFYEDGLYGFLQYTDKPAGGKFRRWIRREVLPAINHTGGYIANEDLFINTYLPYADENTKLLFKNNLSLIREQNNTISMQKLKITEQSKEIEHKEGVIINLVDEISLAEKRQVLNRVVRYKGANIQERWRELYKQFEMKYHLNLKSRLKKYNDSHKPKLNNKLDYVDKVLNKIPEIYEIACKLYENDVKELVQQMYEFNSYHSVSM